MNKQVEAISKLRSTVLFNYYQMLDNMNAKMAGILDALSENPRFVNADENKTKRLFSAIVKKYKSVTDLLILMDEELNKRMFKDLSIKFDYKEFGNEVMEMELFSKDIIKQIELEKSKKEDLNKKGIGSFFR